MKLYLAGPMSGIRQFNYPAFNKVAEDLRNPTHGGHEVFNPAERDTPEVLARVMESPDGDVKALEGLIHMSYGDFIAAAIKTILDGDFDGVVVLPGWEESTGARAETFAAHLKRIPVYTIEHYYGGSFGLWEVARSTMLRAWEGD